MPNKKQLELAGERIRAQVTDIMGDEKLSGTERMEKLKGIQAEKDALDIDIKNHESAEAMTKGLPVGGEGAAPDTKGVQDFGAGTDSYVTDWNPRRKAAQMALQIMQHPMMAQTIKSLGGTKGMMTGLKASSTMNSRSG